MIFLMESKVKLFCKIRSPKWVVEFTAVDSSASFIKRGSCNIILSVATLRSAGIFKFALLKSRVSVEEKVFVSQFILLEDKISTSFAKIEKDKGTKNKIKKVRSFNVYSY